MRTATIDLCLEANAAALQIRREHPAKNLIQRRLFSGVTTTILAKVCDASGTWKNVTAAVTAGASSTLTLTNRDDNYTGDPTYARFDDATLDESGLAVQSIEGRTSGSAPFHFRAASPRPRLLIRSLGDAASHGLDLRQGRARESGLFAQAL